MRPSLATCFCASGSVIAALAPAIGVLAGCASPPPRRPIGELYREALGASRITNDPADAVAREPRAGTPSAAAAPSGTRWSTFPARPAPSSVEPPAPPPRVDTSPRVSDTFVETDVREAIQSLAAQAQARVAIDESVRGSVSAAIADLPFESALEQILVARNCSFVRRDGLYIVGSADPKSPTFPLLAETADYVPLHLTPKELVESLPKFAGPFVTTTESRNAVIVTAPGPLARRIIEDLRRLDRAVPQVVFEAIICEYAPNSRFELGFDGKLGFPADGKFANLGLQTLEGTALGAPAGATALGVLPFQFYSAFVHALATEGYVSVRASPRVMVRDGERANITIGETTYFTVANDRFFFTQLQQVQTGITLDITPRIRGREVSVKIEKAEVSDEMRPTRFEEPKDFLLPTVNTRRVSTTVTVLDGTTIVLGGLVRRRRIQRVQQIPLLGDIPGLGALFQRRVEDEEESEVAIFLSPRLVKEPS